MRHLSIPAGIDWPVQFCVLVSVVTYVASIVTSNVSQVDRLWTFLPTIYTAYYALLPLWPNKQHLPFTPYTPKSLGHDIVKDFSPRALLMLALAAVWTCRLSYNTWRRGLFALNDEDYRWAVLRKRVPAWFFQVVNLTFIAAIQNVLLLLLGLPAAIASTLQPHDSLSTSDKLLAALALLILALEFTADNQQYAFQSFKHAYLAREKGDLSVEQYDEKKHWPGARLTFTPADARRGFITRGLWAWSRHPNFACEQSFWWIINLMPLLAPPPPFLPGGHEIPMGKFLKFIFTEPSRVKSLLAPLIPDILYILPAAALTLLFISSTLFTESISKSKYPKAYAAYQKRVAMFDPSTTVWKSVIHYLFRNEAEKRTIDALVWGEPEDAKKVQ
ncbi:hypothetical protein M378DRAFT_110916 [Amanita muscaria Koide BX008]|uniref:DUF1295-domain-containing protein n=1 Tax=Amanita muscaria (strain Koide BX008) TaxID=946122 RepID=A0A0C2WTB4_AMAMK|nr:hypothetical protein M378DRAFT_110916 [Amanita muscaria Koide BX008]